MLIVGWRVISRSLILWMRFFNGHRDVIDFTRRENQLADTSSRISVKSTAAPAAKVAPIAPTPKKEVVKENPTKVSKAKITSMFLQKSRWVLNLF